MNKRKRQVLEEIPSENELPFKSSENSLNEEDSPSTLIKTPLQNNPSWKEILNSRPNTFTERQEWTKKLVNDISQGNEANAVAMLKEVIQHLECKKQKQNDKRRYCYVLLDIFLHRTLRKGTSVVKVVNIRKGFEKFLQCYKSVLQNKPRKLLKQLPNPTEPKLLADYLRETYQLEIKDIKSRTWHLYQVEFNLKYSEDKNWIKEEPLPFMKEWNLLTELQQVKIQKEFPYLKGLVIPEIPHSQQLINAEERAQKVEVEILLEIEALQKKGILPMMISRIGGCVIGCPQEKQEEMFGSFTISWIREKIQKKMDGKIDKFPSAFNTRADLEKYYNEDLSWFGHPDII